jgi:hypothetical protein
MESASSRSICKNLRSGFRLKASLISNIIQAQTVVLVVLIFGILPAILVMCRNDYPPPHWLTTPAMNL